MLQPNNGIKAFCILFLSCPFHYPQPNMSLTSLVINYHIPYHPPFPPPLFWEAMGHGSPKHWPVAKAYPPTIVFFNSFSFICSFSVANYYNFFELEDATFELWQYPKMLPQGYRILEPNYQLWLRYRVFRFHKILKQSLYLKSQFH